MIKSLVLFSLGKSYSNEVLGFNKNNSVMNFILQGTLFISFKQLYNFEKKKEKNKHNKKTVKNIVMVNFMC